MNSQWPKLLAVIALVVLIPTAWFWMTARGGSAAAGEDVVYVCSETGQTVVAPLQATPAINPAIGKATLLRGVYCPKCDRWYAMPPSDHAAGNPKPLICRVHNVPMTTDGPKPAQQVSTP